MTEPGSLTNPAAQQAFNAAYWASQDPRIVAAFKEQSASDLNAPTAEQELSDRLERGKLLASEGLLIDKRIMVEMADPYWTMFMRRSYGMTWEPSLFGAPVQIIGPANPGYIQYDPAHPPAGSIKVSLDLADYPPFPKLHAAPKPAGPSDLVGKLISGKEGMVGSTYEALWPASDTMKNGESYSDGNHSFKFVRPGLFFGYWFELVEVR